MKGIDKMTDLKELDAKFGLAKLSLLGDDEDGKKKKKKKKKEKADGDWRDKSLKEMSKKELLKVCESEGVEASAYDADDKKSMRKAIKWNRELMKTTSTKHPKKLQKSSLNTTPGRERPPYFYDFDGDTFVIDKPLTTKDITVFQAMQSLGKMRRDHHGDDGFAEMMDRITKRLEHDDEDEVIEVVNHADDGPVGLKDGKVVAALPEKTEKYQEVIELQPDEVQKLSDDVDKAIEKLEAHKSKKKK